MILHKEHKISIIVPFFLSNKKDNKHNDGFALESFNKCLLAISRIKNYSNYEVILVSDNSSKESISIAEKYPFKIKKLKKNFGAAYARNKGAIEAKGEVLLFIDSDVEIHPKTLQIINKYNNNKKFSGVLQGVYSHKPVYKNIINQYLQSYWCYFIFLATNGHKYTQVLCSCLFSIKKDIFFKVGMFNRDFKKADPEDVHLGYRLIKNGYKISLERKMSCKHHINLTLYTFIKRTLRIHHNECLMHLKDSTLITKIQTVNYDFIIPGIVLIFLLISLSISSFFYPVLYFREIFIVLNFLFLLTNIVFLKFILIEKNFFIALRIIPLIYLHRFLFIICFFSGIVSFYILGKKSSIN